jgi:acetolactate synthase-1/2/3 large subunit
MNRTPTVAAVIAGDLAAYGARCCFGLLGTANFKISHALVEAGVELISARHECNAASMGDAYAKATGELTLVSVHSGPGLTNALTGIRRTPRVKTRYVLSPAPCAIVRPWCLACLSTCSMRPSPRTSRH